MTGLQLFFSLIASFMMPGLGQIWQAKYYEGRIERALLLLTITTICLWTIIGWAFLWAMPLLSFGEALLWWGGPKVSRTTAPALALAALGILCWCCNPSYAAPPAQVAGLILKCTCGPKCTKCDGKCKVCECGKKKAIAPVLVSYKVPADSSDRVAPNGESRFNNNFHQTRGRSRTRWSNDSRTTVTRERSVDVNVIGNLDPDKPAPAVPMVPPVPPAKVQTQSCPGGACNVQSGCSGGRCGGAPRGLFRRR